MGKVIPMFRTDEITGLQVPNVPYKPDYFIVDEYGRSEKVYPTYQKALADLHKYPNHQIVKM